ncbi:MAG TPA: trypsin-like peptidase domain-containing protein [Acetobacteraceae bacterium]|nr:trypsin-like peptidase domain-containing protein [Acetobacteraceae bacterium]
MRRALFPVLALVLFAAAPFGRNATAAPCCTQGYADLLDHVLPAVVSLSVVKVTGTQPADGQLTARRQRFFGSGFVIDPSGVIVTNRHVIQDAVEITAIFHDNTQARARLLGAANVADLAVLKVDTGRPLPALDLADSSGARIGDPVLAIGNPYGLGMSVSAGIISGLNRNLNQTPFDDDIQTDAAINPGNSGGPLVTVGGQVVGVNTALYTQNGGGYIGIGYAIPANDADFIVRHLLDPKLPQPGWIGVTAQDVSPEVAKGFGVPRPGGAIVTAIDENGPARDAGLRPGDVILAVGGSRLSDTRAMVRTIALMDIGSTTDLTIWRDHKEQTVQITPVEWPNMGSPVEAAMAPAAMAAMAPAPDPDLKLAAITDAVRQQFGIPAGVVGVLVEAASENADLGEQGLRPGEVIVNVNGVPVGRPDQVEHLIGTARSAQQTYLPFLVSGKDGLRWVSYYTGIKERG